MPGSGRGLTRHLNWQLCMESWSGMGLDFEMLLPEDDELIEERADALGAWCEAFLAGLGLSGELSKDIKALRRCSSSARRFV